MIRYIIDGHNFIHHIPRYITLLDHDYVTCLKSLYRDLLNYSDSRQVKIVLVFDGNAPWDPLEHSNNLILKFSGPDRNADMDIIAQAEKWKGRHTVVVTEDRQIIRSVAALGCQTLLPKKLFRIIEEKIQPRKLKQTLPNEKPDRLSRTEIDWWKKEMKKAQNEKTDKDE